ncbi:MAG: Hsp20/alpha crystallin family protein [Candidatus Gracilibacteria bacterium]
MFKGFKGNQDNDEEENHGDHRHDSIDVKMADDDIIEEELGQVALDILEGADQIHIIAPIAGIEREKINISIHRNILTIEGERQHPEVYDTAQRILVEECFYGPFSRSVILPENLAFDKITATMDNNLLCIEIPKLLFGEKTIKINKLQG